MSDCIDWRLELFGPPCRSGPEEFDELRLSRSQPSASVDSSDKHLPDVTLTDTAMESASRKTVIDMDDDSRRPRACDRNRPLNSDADMYRRRMPSESPKHLF